MPRRSARSIRWRPTGRLSSWTLLAALALAAVALAAISIHTVSRESRVRRQLLVDTYRGVADLAAARIADEITRVEEAVATALGASVDGPTLVRALAEVERAHPSLAPIVVLSRAAAQVGPAAPATGTFEELIDAAGREEHLHQRHVAAALVYERAVAAASNAAGRVRALNGLGRTRLKAGQVPRARQAYQELIESADLFDPEQARFAAVAWSQLAECARRVADSPAERAAVFALLTHIADYRFVLDRDTADFYRQMGLDDADRLAGGFDGGDRRQFDAQLARLDALAGVDDLLRPGTASPQGDVWVHVVDGPRAAVAITMNAASLARLVDDVLPDVESSSSVALAVVGADGRVVWSAVSPASPDAVRASVTIPGSGGYRLAAFPRTGSLEAEAAREVRRYAFFLVLVCLAVVTALALAARSVRRELMLSRLRTEFVSGVSHELKTPLALIRMFAESLREGWVGETQKAEYYDVITRESERLTGLIGNVLDFSRIEAGTRTYRFAVADLRQVVGDLLSRYEFHLKAARIDLVRQLPEEAVPARIDRDAIEQTLVNLLSNAVKYMGGPDRTPRTVTVTLEPAGDRVELRVSDTGIGMSEEHRRHIFERFFRADDEAVRAVPGSGLGLTLVEAHVDAHAGTIVVESAPGRGSTFTIDLPLAGEGGVS